MEYQTGSMVKCRGRDWIVTASGDPELVLLKPLGGSDEEMTGIYLPFRNPHDKIEPAHFPLPTERSIGDISSSRLLFEAARLGFREGAGPFRSLAKLSFRPRSYQMVPLIMALKQPDPVRLFIADDVGIGKTIESLMIVKEFLDRKIITRFAVIALPHLCDQWQQELRSKFGIDAVIIRSNTQAGLDRQIFGDTSVYQYYPYQIISIDYIKSDQRRQIFINECPEMIIVDEAHSCSNAAGQNSSQQQRYNLLKDLAAKPDQSIIMLSATPHSGKSGQFGSLLGMLHDEFSEMDVPNSSETQRKHLASHYVQRRRGDILKWGGQENPFPQRESGEIPYNLSPSYALFYNQAFDFAFQAKTDQVESGHRQRFRSWTALTLMRGIMSSPAAGKQMLENKLYKAGEDVDVIDEDNFVNPIMEDDYSLSKDFIPTDVAKKAKWTESERKKIKSLSEEIENLYGIENDSKAAKALEILRQWLKEGYNPVIFCRFIATANYLGEILEKELGDKILVQTVTSEDPDEIRKERIKQMEVSERKVLVATDCLSEGINLQEQFTAVMHYDLPWNPNRLEQREGRVDRFGQEKSTVKTFLLFGTDNPIDGAVLEILLRKVKEIRRDTGISIPFPEESQSLLDSILQSVISRGKSRITDEELYLFEEEMSPEEKESKQRFTHELEKAAGREKASRSIFAQRAIKDEEIEEDLKQIDESLGTPSDVQDFVIRSMMDLFGVQTGHNGEGWEIVVTNIPEILRNALQLEGEKVKISFESPTPEGFHYIGRNHPFVELLCHTLLSNSLECQDVFPARAAVIRTKDVIEKTTLLLYRVRNVIKQKKTGKELVAEEMICCGYRSGLEKTNLMVGQEPAKLLFSVKPSDNLSPQSQNSFLEKELVIISNNQGILDEIAMQRAEKLVAAHERFRKAVQGNQYEVVKPVLPMDLLGIYILLPSLGGEA